MSNHIDYSQLISNFIQKQMVMLGPNLVLSKARKIPGLAVSDGGVVTALGPDGAKTFSELSEYFLELSGHTTQLVLERLSEKYPSLKKSLP